MSEEAVLTFVVPEGSGTVTNMAGESIGYLRKHLVSEGLTILDDAEVKVFSMGPNEASRDEILEQADGISYEKTDTGLKILQGFLLTVTDGYILSTDDIAVTFGEQP